MTAPPPEKNRNGDPNEPQGRGALIYCIARAAEEREESPGRHLLRVAAYCRTLAEALGLDREFTRQLVLASPLHDVGNVWVPKQVLNKRGGLTDGEWEVMKQHCALGAMLLRSDGDAAILERMAGGGGALMDEATDGGDPFLEFAASLALTHHERWDGTGYPAALAGGEIPLGARVFAIGDVYDALRSVRPYKPAFSEPESFKIIARESGQHFDPDVAAAFEQERAALDEVFRELSDEEARVPLVS